MSEESLPTEPLCRFRLHAAPALEMGGIWQPLERKAAALLAWLALHGPCSRQRLADLLWPSSGEEAARNSLRQLLFKLRKAGAAALVEGTDPLRLGTTWRLQAQGSELLAGWSFDDCPEFDHWLAQARQDARRRQLALALQGIDVALAEGDSSRALSAAQTLLADDPACEPAHLRHVQALYLEGRLREALADGQTRAEALREHHGVTPSAEFDRLLLTLRAAAERAQPPQVPVQVLRPPHLVGRQLELALLADARTAALVPMVAGEPGLGKSRLLAEHLAATPGGLLLACRPGDAGVPFGALARWLRTVHAVHPHAALPGVLMAVLPEHATGGSGARAPGGDVVAGAAEALASAVAAGLSDLAVDDLHFADSASIEALGRLFEWPTLQALRWALARRPAEGQPAVDHLGDALLDGGRLTLVTLAPLDATGVQELLVSLRIPGLADTSLGTELWQATGGNPMFVLETLKTLILQPPGARVGLPRPPNVAALVQRRLRQLTPMALNLARVAALAGPDFDATLAGSVLAVPVLSLADAWQELEAAQVVRGQAFAHDLIYEATLASIPAPVRMHTRRAIAEHLVTRHGEPARIAAHWLAADDPARAAPQFAAAGRRAEASARYGEAQQLMEQAARCHEGSADPAAAFETRLALADLLMEAGELQACSQTLDALDRSGLEAEQRVRALMQRMHLLSRLGESAEAARLGQRALADPVLHEDGSQLGMAKLRWTLAMVLRATGHGEAALAQLALAEPLLANTPDATWQCWFHSQHAVALLLIGRASDASVAQSRATEAARALGRHRLLAGCLQNGATLATAAGQLVEALGMVDECLLLMADTGGGDIFTLHVRVQRARLLVWMGRYQEALGMLEPLSKNDGAHLNAGNRVRVWAALAELWTHLAQRGRADAARAVLARPAQGTYEREQVSLALEEINWLDGLDTAPGLLEIITSEPGLSALHSAWARLMTWRRQTQGADADELARTAQAWRELGLRGHALVADVVLAAAHARQGELDDVARHAEAALVALRRLGAPGIYRPWLYLSLTESTHGLDALRQRALADGAQWVQNVSRYQVPAAFRTGFLKGNKVNARLLALAAG